MLQCVGRGLSAGRQALCTPGMTCHDSFARQISDSMRQMEVACIAIQF